MIEFSDKDVADLLKEYKGYIQGGRSSEETEAYFTEEFKKYFERKAILGLDIFQYSLQPTLKQALIPYLFKKIYKITIENCLDGESFIFCNKKESDFTDFFLDAGDGGFQIFDNPLQAIVFSIYFQANINRYHSSGIYPVDTLEAVGKITFRYCLTYDNVYKYEKNFYGPAIINNARVISKDKLNRFLIDDNSVSWFTKELNGIENLQALSFEDDFKNIKMFEDFFKIKLDKDPTVLFSGKQKIINLDLLKIGEIYSKFDKISIHNLHIQIVMRSPLDITFKKFTISLGNLNSSGITE